MIDNLGKSSKSFRHLAKHIWYIHPREYYSAIKRNELQINPTSWMDFKSKKITVLKGYMLHGYIYVTFLKYHKLQQWGTVQ